VGIEAVLQAAVEGCDGGLKWMESASWRCGAAPAYRGAARGRCDIAGLFILPVRTAHGAFVCNRVTCLRVGITGVVAIPAERSAPVDQYVARQVKRGSSVGQG
jgi:hypothetical protein